MIINFESKKKLDSVNEVEEKYKKVSVNGPDLMTTPEVTTYDESFAIFLKGTESETSKVNKKYKN